MSGVSVDECGVVLVNCHMTHHSHLNALMSLLAVDMMSLAFRHEHSSFTNMLKWVRVQGWVQSRVNQ